MLFTHSSPAGIPIMLKIAHSTLHFSVSKLQISEEIIHADRFIQSVLIGLSLNVKEVLMAEPIMLAHASVPTGAH